MLILIFRVSCYGNATIVEVSYQKKAITEEESEEKAALKSQTEAEIDSIKQKIAKLNKHKERCYMRIKVVQNEQQILESYSKCVSSVSTSIIDLIVIYFSTFHKVLIIMHFP